MSAGLLASLFGGVVLLFGQAAADTAPAKEYASADEAYRVGSAYYRSKNYQASREPLRGGIAVGQR